MTHVLLTWLSTPTPAQRTFGISVKDALERVVNNPAFLADVRKAAIASALLRNFRRRIVDGELVAAIIANGQDASEESGDGVIDLRIRITDLVPGLFGDVIEGSHDIDTDLQFFARCVDKNDVASMVQLWIHEWLHVAGFRHIPGGRLKDAAYVVDEIALRYATQVLAEPVAPARASGETPELPPDRSTLIAHKRAGSWRCQVAHSA